MDCMYVKFCIIKAAAFLFWLLQGLKCNYNTGIVVQYKLVASYQPEQSPQASIRRYMSIMDHSLRSCSDAYANSLVCRNVLLYFPQRQSLSSSSSSSPLFAKSNLDLVRTNLLVAFVT
ncbi:expressed unknown protein [Seminavis robusta]|uniref:Uncharacterized protein n=1 Tax=Seminavis robusta TaxID=568900 RepID=A0A9N8HSY6_9STRA|nr:expressed unknown protein [Seminavis robusta]|eukprot:Sro1795_g297991.1  (118) ;mRNA; r:1456-1809